MGKGGSGARRALSGAVGERRDDRGDEPFVVAEVHGDGFGVGAGVEGDLFVLGQALADEGFHAVEVAEGRHGADFAVGEADHEFVFGGQVHVAGAEGVHEAVEIDVVARGQDGHGEFALDVDDDGFGHFLVRNVGGERDLVGGEAGRVGDGDVFDPVGIEEVLQFFGNHGGGVWFGIGRTAGG